MQLKSFSIWYTTPIWILLVLGFTNCAPGFKTLTESELLSLSSQAVPAGKIIYDKNCASCHSAFEISTKKGRSAEEITNAIKAIPQMSHLKSLAAADIQLISDALSGRLPGGAGFACVAPQSRGMGEKKLRRMNRVEMVSTFTELMNASVISDSQIQIQLGILPKDTLNMTAADIAADHSDSHVTTMLNIAVRAADLTFENAALRDKVYGACAASPNDTCAQSFIQNFGLKAYRRPLTATEKSNLFNQYKTASGTEGLKRTLIRMLMSPSMAYHLEIDGTVQGTRQRLTDYEIASRLSYRLTGAPPDATLLSAAASGSLQNITNLKAQAQRLLTGHPNAKVRMREFFNYYLQTDQVPEPNVAAAQLNNIDPNGLKNEMLQEMTDYIEHIVWTKKGPFRDLLTSREVFPRSDRMARILEASVASGTTPSMTNQAHAGLVLRPAMLAASEKLTKPFHRAAMVRKRILCDTFGAPDAALVTERQNALGDLSNLPNRERLTKITDNLNCMTCHSKLNPVSFVLEGYDQLGMKRTVETVFDSMNKPSKTFPIDTRVTNPSLEDDRGTVTSLQNATELADVIARGPTAKTCFAQMVFEYQRARLLSPEDFCALSEVEKTVMNGGSVLDAYMTSIVNEDIFWKAKGN